MKTALKLPLGGGGVQRPGRTVPRSPSQPAGQVHLAPVVKPSSGPHLLPKLAASQGQAVQTDPMEDAMRWLAARVTAECKGFGASEDEVLRTLRSRGIECSFVKNRKRLFRVPGENVQVYASEVIRALQEEIGQPTNNGRPAVVSAPTSSSTPAAAPAAPAAPAPSASGSLEGLAAWISANYMGMGKSAADALPELRRKGITASGNSFRMGGQVMSAQELASALRLQARTPSRSSTPEPARAAPSAVPAGYSAPATPAPAAPAASASGSLDSLAAFISANYMGMGKSAADVLPELRCKGITASGNSFSMGGQLMSAAEIASALRLQARTPSRPSTPEPARPAPSTAPVSYSAQPAAAPSAASAGSASGSLESLAAFISANYMGMGKSAADVLPELRRKGITASGSSFSMGGQLMSAAEVASALRLQARTPSRPSTPEPARPAPSAAPASYSAPAAPAPAAPATSASGLEGLAAYISANYMGMGKSAADALPELRRKGITASGSDYVMGGQVMSVQEIANTLRLQARTPSRPSSPQPSRPAPSAAPASYSAPAAAPAAPAPAGSASGSLESLAAYISANYMGMGKSAADALPELRRKGITASSNSFSMGGQLMSADGIAQALRLQARTPSRPSTPPPARPAPAPAAAPAVPPPAPAPAPAAAPAIPTAGSDGLQGLADWISANFMGMGKSAVDSLPELRRKGIAASGSNYVMSGRVMSAPEIASALRLQARTPSRPSTPQPTRPTSSAAPAPAAAAPAAPAASASGSLDSLAAWISANYMGMGRSAADVLPELRRKGITASGNSFSMGGQLMSAPEIASALRLQARTPSRPSTPDPTRPAPSAAPAPAPAAAPAAPSAGSDGLQGLAAWISANYMGMGKSAADALPELRRKGITASGNSYVIGGKVMSAPEIASALRLEARPGSRPTSPARSAEPAAAPPSPPPRAPSPPPPTTFGAKAGGPSELSPTEAIKAGTEWLASWIAANYVGMGKSGADALPELRRRGVVCTYVKDGHHLFRYPGEPTQVDAPQVAKMLQLRPR